MKDNRVVVSFDNDHDETIKTLMAYTYGHTIPLDITSIDEEEPKVALRINDSVPDQYVDQAKQICNDGRERYMRE